MSYWVLTIVAIFMIQGVEPFQESGTWDTKFPTQEACIDFFHNDEFQTEMNEILESEAVEHNLKQGDKIEVNLTCTKEEKEHN